MQDKKQRREMLRQEPHSPRHVPTETRNLHSEASCHSSETCEPSVPRRQQPLVRQVGTVGRGGVVSCGPVLIPASRTASEGRTPSQAFKEKQKPDAQTMAEIYSLSRIPFNSSMKMSGSLHPGLHWSVPSISQAALRR